MNYKLLLLISIIIIYCYTNMNTYEAMTCQQWDTRADTECPTGKVLTDSDTDYPDMTVEEGQETCCIDPPPSNCQEWAESIPYENKCGVAFRRLKDNPETISGYGTDTCCEDRDMFAGEPTGRAAQLRQSRTAEQVSEVFQEPSSESTEVETSADPTSTDISGRYSFITNVSETQMDQLKEYIRYLRCD